ITFDQQLEFAQFAYRVTASNIFTSAIDSRLIMPTTLPDGSEGLELDWNAATPMLTTFFGNFDRPPAAKESTATRNATATKTPSLRRRTVPTRTRVPVQATKRPALPTPTATSSGP